MKQHYKAIAERQDRAIRHLLEQLTNVVPMDDATARKVASYYLKHKLAKLDNFHGVANVTYGAYLDASSITHCMELVK